MQERLAVAAARAAQLAERVFQTNGDVLGALAGDRMTSRAAVGLRYLTWRKALNIALIEVQLRFGVMRLRGLPFEWEIDTTNICQLRCPLCHTGLGNIKREQGTMDYELFKDTIDQIHQSCMWLTLYSWGEPFLNPHIHDFVGYAHRRGIGTIISTNLNKPLNETMAENIIRSGLDIMIISLDGTTQEVYQQYRVNGLLSRVTANIELLARKKRQLGMQTPRLEWQFIVMRQNEHQIPEARRMAERLGVDSIVFKKVDFPHKMESPELSERWLPTSPDYLRARPFDKPYEENGDRCWRLWRSAVVNWDGGFAPCCYLTDKAHDFGDVNEHSVAEIWNNSNYLEARGLFKDGHEPQHAVGCGGCPVYLNSAAARKRGPIELTFEPAPTKRAPFIPEAAPPAGNGNGSGNVPTNGSSGPLDGDSPAAGIPLERTPRT